MVFAPCVLSTARRRRSPPAQIYNEEVRDLVQEANTGEPVRGGLAIVEDPVRGPVVHGQHEEVVRSAGDLRDLCARGERARSTAATNMNERSSRSHVIVRVVIECADSLAPADAGDADSGSAVSELSSESRARRVRMATLSLVDLAGSERSKKAGTEGARLREGAAINRSLLTLGNVIQKLSEPKAKRGHVPYRDSKLTRLLATGLGGNARGVMLAMVSPAAASRSETMSTLR